MEVNVDKTPLYMEVNVDKTPLYMFIPKIYNLVHVYIKTLCTL